MVAPLAGAWIEIEYNTYHNEWSKMSLPSRERGLKYAQFIIYADPSGSLPSRERGLKCL